MPQRIQLRRIKGWRMPANTVSVARPTKWGNPFRLEPKKWTHDTFSIDCVPYRCYGVFSNRSACVEFYRFWLLYSPQAERLREALPELRGKDLACWCGLDEPCHADVLLEIANR